MKVQLIKIKDHVFNGHHPNNINVGSIITMDDVLDRNEIAKPVIGQSYFFRNRYTSNVVAITKKNGNIEFETQNSTYLIKFGDD